MAKCTACGKRALFTTTFGKVEICKKCGSLLNVNAWCDRNFKDKDELMQCKQNTLQIANANGMSQSFVLNLTEFYDEYINDGFTATIDGEAGQKLKIFEKYCVIYTKSEIKRDNLRQALAQIAEESLNSERNEYNEDRDTQLLSTDDKIALVKNVLKGNVASAGIAAATTAVINKKNREESEERAENIKAQRIERMVNPLVTLGERIIEYKSLSKVQIIHKTGTGYGILQFAPAKKSSKKLSAYEYFFYKKSIFKKTTKADVENAKSIITNLINATNQSSTKKQTTKSNVIANIESSTPSTPEQNKFNDIREYKRLLDEGIITEAEFEIKKKELLNL